MLLEGLKYKWLVCEVDNSVLLNFCSVYNISIPVMQVLLSRGYCDKSSLDSYLFSVSDRDVFDPTLLKDASKAVERIIRAIENKEKILICGDYDVDGITSSAMMMICLLPLGANINFFLPNRIKDGYGLSATTVQKAYQNNYKILITVDNGITAFKAGELAMNLGIDLIITDHHKPHDKVPESYAIVNPHQTTCFYPYKYFAGVGVTFKILDLLYKTLGKELPVKVYELLLLGTIADVVPLTGENRFWVRYGLNYINQTESNSLTVLKENARIIKPKINSLDIGFFLTPQINALGRLQDPRDGVKFLIGSDLQETRIIGTLLKELNESRRLIERAILEEIELRIKNKIIDLESESIIMACSNSWQAGVIGLVASRLMNAHNRPAILLHVNDGIAKGSCRSIVDFNIFNALNECKDLLIQFGGHAVAAGFSLKEENLPKLKEKLEFLFKKQIPIIDPKQKIKLDGQMTLGDANKKLIDDMAYLEPFGNENVQPIFYLTGVTIIESPVILKDLHVKIKIFADGIMKPVIFFNRPELYSILQNKVHEVISLAVKVSQNYFNDRVNIEFEGIDIKL